MRVFSENLIFNSFINVLGGLIMYLLIKVFVLLVDLNFNLLNVFEFLLFWMGTFPAVYAFLVGRVMWWTLITMFVNVCFSIPGMKFCTIIVHFLAEKYSKDKFCWCKNCFWFLERAFLSEVATNLHFHYTSFCANQRPN